jgi:hypothetical protein
MSVGLEFELLCVRLLNESVRGLIVRHCGGRGDEGVDLIGKLFLPCAILNVVGQCKSHSRKLGPTYVREMKGISSPESLALLISSSGFSKTSVNIANSLDVPLWLVEVDGEHIVNVQLNESCLEKFPFLSLGFGFSETKKKRVPIILFENETVLFKGKT